MTKEFVNHKILDLAGDFIIGYRILEKLIATKEDTANNIYF